MDKSKQPILSICIPTYNRDIYLKRLVDSIISQKEFINTNDVEIIISDNASTDSTKDMVTKYINNYWDKIKFFQNEENIWMCWNLYKVRTLWTGKYLWLMWSDQKLSANSLWIILKKIVNQNTIKTVIMTNSQRSSSCLMFNWFSDFSTYVWQHQPEFLDMEWWLLTFMSYCIMSYEYFLYSVNFLKNILDEKKIINNYFSFNVIRYSQLYWNNSILYIQDYIFSPAEDAESSWTINRKIIKDLKLIINYIENNYFVSKSAKRLFKKIKKIWITAYVTLPLKRLCKLFHLERMYSKLGWLYRWLLNKM